MYQDRRARLGKRLRDARVARQETQQEVASAVGIHRTHLSRIEGGGENITLETMWALADHLGVPTGLLVTDTELVEYIAELVAIRDASAESADHPPVEVQGWIDEALKRGVTNPVQRDG